MQAACKVLNEALEEDFGFTEMIWVFSGRRGIHCWVCDERAKKMNNQVRESIINYLSLIQGNEKSTSFLKAGILKDNMHPSVE